MTRSRLFLMAAAACLAMETQAADGRMHIAQHLMPVTITNAGSYVVTENLTGSNGMAGITINADDVTLDLNGFTLRGVAGSLDGIAVPTPRSDLVIINGIVRDWGDDGVDALQSSNAVLRDLGLFNNANGGARAGFNSLVERCRAVANGGYVGPHPPATNSLGVGFHVENGSVVRYCVAVNNNSHGLVGHSGSTVSFCALGGNVHDGFHGSHATVVRGCAVGANSEGIEVDSGCSVVDSVSGENQEDGVRTKKAELGPVCGGSVIAGCTAFANVKNGIDIQGGGSTVQGCVVYSNQDHGIRLLSGNMVRANLSSRNNPSNFKRGCVMSESGNRVEGNHLVENYKGLEAETNGNIIVGNSAAQNAGGNYSISAGNHFDTISNPGTSIPKEPWGNFGL
jgi:hypothetical protein